MKAKDVTDTIAALRQACGPMPMSLFISQQAYDFMVKPIEVKLWLRSPK